MTYEVGQKILVEATVTNPMIDRDGDIRVDLGEFDDFYLPAAKTRPIDPEPKVVAFSEVQVGDVVRVTLNHVEGVEIAYSGVVTGVPAANTFNIGNRRTVWLDQSEDGSIELISRPEPEPIKVGDIVTVEQVKTLPVGSVVTKDYSRLDIKDRMVTKTGLYNPEDTVWGWNVYDGDTFTVKYIAEAS